MRRPHSRTKITWDADYERIYFVCLFTTAAALSRWLQCCGRVLRERSVQQGRQLVAAVPPLLLAPHISQQNPGRVCSLCFVHTLLVDIIVLITGAQGTKCIVSMQCVASCELHILEIWCCVEGC